MPALGKIPRKGCTWRCQWLSIGLYLEHAWTGESMVPLTSSFSLFILIMLSSSSCLSSSLKCRDSISWKCTGCPRFRWSFWAFLSFNQTIQNSVAMLTHQKSLTCVFCQLWLWPDSCVLWPGCVGVMGGQKSGRGVKRGAWLELTRGFGREKAEHLPSTIRVLVQWNQQYPCSTAPRTSVDNYCCLNDYSPTEPSIPTHYSQQGVYWTPSM